MKNKIILICVLAFSGVVNAQQETILIGAASDLKFALDSLIIVFTQHRPTIQVNVTYGSSGKLYEQISHGAPFDMFFSADIEYPANLKKKGIAVSTVSTYGVGRLVIWGQKKNPVVTDIHALVDKRISKISIANPQHAPYGRRAEEALKHYNVYEQIKDKLVYGENISQAAQFVTVGAADVGIIALSLALSPQMKRLGGYFYPVSPEAHQPLRQGFVVLQHAKSSTLAWEFYRFMSTDPALNILSHFGFSNDTN